MQVPACLISFYTGLLKYFTVGVSSKLVRFNMSNILQWLRFHILKVYIWRNDQLPLFIWIYLYNRNNLHEPSLTGNSWGKTLPWVVVFIHFRTFLKGCLSWSTIVGTIDNEKQEPEACYLIAKRTRQRRKQSDPFHIVEWRGKPWWQWHTWRHRWAEQIDVCCRNWMGG